jgi:hypothetical protein
VRGLLPVAIGVEGLDHTFWHKVSVAVLQPNVRFRGNSGLRTALSRFLLMTQSGHW